MDQTPATLSFEAFMERALHHPRHGYYARRIRGVGRGGDFTTAPMLSSALAKAVAAWAADALGSSGCRDLIELGPGEGRLAAEVFKRLPWLARRRTRLHLVETSLPLAAKQRARLGETARWHRSPAGALAACDGRAVIYSNEFADAFPVRLFEKQTDGEWREIGLHETTAGFREVVLPPAPPPASSGFSAAHPPGQRIEVHDSYHRWLAGWLPGWRAGRLLTIDYGAEAGQLYHRRPGGTLRAYLFQQRLTGPAVYEHIGRQDITADVNFSDLIDWSSPWAGTRRLARFGEFIRPFADPRDPRDRALADPAGAGGAFLVLDQEPHPSRA